MTCDWVDVRRQEVVQEDGQSVNFTCVKKIVLEMFRQLFTELILQIISAN